MYLWIKKIITQPIKNKNKPFTTMKTKLLIASILLCGHVWAQTKFTLSGKLKDATNGEDLIGASVYVSELKTGVASNIYGFYSIALPSGTYNITISSIGYESMTKEIKLDNNIVLDLQLKPALLELQELVVSGNSLGEQLDEIGMSSAKLNIGTVRKMPAFFGEVDILKSIQMLPGVQSAGEGTTGYFVRGGTVDQNLIQLDEVTVYNASHLMGFFSVFNTDALKDSEFYKGGIPARYGGRLSSLLDLRMKEGNQKKLSGTGGIGTIASRFTLEGPIQKDQSSFIISGRRTYADLFLMASPDEKLNNSRLFFYDLNTKINFSPSKKDRIMISGYFGDDVLKYKGWMSWSWGNRTGSMRWNHIFNEKLFANFTTLYSNFNYSIGSDTGPAPFTWKSNIQDVSAKSDFTYFVDDRFTLDFGMATTLHKFNPGHVTVVNDSITKELTIDNKTALESALYLSSDITISDRLSMQTGVRYSIFQNMGGRSYSNWDVNGNPMDTLTYRSTEVTNTYSGIEPRFSMRYKLNNDASIKFSYNHLYQYLHLASNSTASLPLDVYMPSDQNIKPQAADQIALGYFRNIKNNSLQFSTEFFYKNLSNQIDFRDNADLLLNNHIDRDVVTGKGRAYGTELMLKKPEGRFSGWISYAYTRSKRKIAEINDGDEYDARQDRPHSVNIVMSYQLRPRLHVSGSWTYASGMPVTLPVASYIIDGVVVPVYSKRNGYRLEASHRLDLSLTLDNKKKQGRNWESSWNFSLFNAYANKNPFSIQTRQSEVNPTQTEAVQLSIIGTIIPSVTYNFKF